MLRGIDVSHHQGAIDWPKVRAAGYTFAFVKATEGATWTDPRFASNLQSARAAGLVVGAYHFLRAESNASDQANHYLLEVEDAAGSWTGVVPILDAETAHNGSNPSARQISEFITRVYQRLSRWPVAYIPRWWARQQGLIALPWQCPLWHSQYPTVVDLTRPPAPWGGWSRMHFWQFTSQARVPGVSGPCDDNAGYLTLGELHQLAGLQEEDDLPYQRHELVTIAQEGARLALNEGSGPGQTTGAGTMRATLDTVQGIVRLLKQQHGALAHQIIDGHGAILAALAALPTADLTEDELQALAVEIGRELADRGLTLDAGAVLDALHLRLAS